MLGMYFGLNLKQKVPVNVSFRHHGGTWKLVVNTITQVLGRCSQLISLSPSRPHVEVQHMAGSRSAEPPEEPQQSARSISTAVTLNLVIRFSRSEIPDISLSVDLPSGQSVADIQPSVNNLKGKLRTRLPRDFGKHGLKLIYAGRVLHGLESVEKALKLDVGALSADSIPFSDTARDGSPANTQDQAAYARPLPSKGKGKSKARTVDVVTAGDEDGSQPLLEPSEGGLRDDAAEPPWIHIPTLYLHCAITPGPLDLTTLASQRTLESEPLARESNHARKLPHVKPFHAQGTAYNAQGPTPESSTVAADSGPATQPRGFDRLLAPSSGFNAAEIQALRSQFRHIIEARYTPDTMPSPTTLLRMEESWLDDSSYSVPGAGISPQSSGAGSAADAPQRGMAAGLRSILSGAPTGAVAGTSDTATPAVDGSGGGYTDDDAAASLDDTYFGVFIGFFWPLGACVWGLREEGVWSRRRGRAVMAGILINLLFGVVKVLS